MYGVIRWCTPSIHPRVPKVNGIYENDMSISYHSLGNPSLNTGVFRKAHDLAARAFHADRTLFSVNGSSGSNFIVTRALSHQLGTVNMLAQRNVHKSISVAVEDFGVNVKYLKPHYDENLQIFIPNTITEFEDAIKKNPNINVVFVSNPTYEGLSLDLPKLVKRIRLINPKIIIYIDEAWGSLFSFSDKMPISAMEAGADICVQSTHKQGSGLQQTSMIHWKGNRISEKYIMDSYKSLISTSPSFHLLASLDGARYLMETQGKEIIDDLIATADNLKKGLRNIKGLKVILPTDITTKYPQVRFVDQTKVLVNVAGTGIAGYDIAKELEKNYKVVVEKYEADNILFITTLQNSEHEAEETIIRLEACLKDLKKQRVSRKSGKAEFPHFPTKIDQRLQPFVIRDKKLASKRIGEAKGLVCAENVVPYPPGIPLIAKGEVIQQEHIDYLVALKKLKGAISVVMNDDNTEKVMIVR